MGPAAMQKTTLLDYPGKVACTVFMGGCNFRCPFCYNCDIVEGRETMEEEDIFRHLEKRRGILDGVAVTGGEPTLWEGLIPFIKRIKAMGFCVKLDTNGNRPDVLKKAVEAGVDYVAMDIKNCRERYGETVGIEGFDTAQVEKSVAFLLGGNTDFEFRTTVVDELHTEADIERLVSWIEGARHYYLQRFRQADELLGTRVLTEPSEEKMEKLLKIARWHIKNAEIRGMD